MTPDISCRSYKSDYKFKDGGQNGGRANLWLYLKRLYFISSGIAYCISPYASFYAGLSSYLSKRYVAYKSAAVWHKIKIPTQIITYFKTLVFLCYTRRYSQTEWDICFMHAAIASIKLPSTLLCTCLLGKTKKNFVFFVVFFFVVVHHTTHRPNEIFDIFKFWWMWNENALSPFS